MNAIRNFFLGIWANHRREVIAAIVVILALGLLLSRCSGGNSAKTFPGGGAGILIIAFLITIGAVARGSAGLWVLAAIFWAIWGYPRVMPILSGWGIVPSIAILLFAGMVVWIVKSGAGFLFWRGVVAIILLFSAVSLSGIINKGIEDLKKVDIPMPSISQPLKDSFSRAGESVENLAEGKSEKMLANSQVGKVSDLNEVNKKKAVFVEVGTAMYDSNLQFVGTTSGKRMTGTVGSEKKSLNGRFLCQVVLEDGSMVFVEPEKIIFAEVLAREKAEAEAKERQRQAEAARAKAKALDKIRQNAERQEAEKKAAEKERKSILTLRPSSESSGPKKYFVLPPETEYGDRFEFLEAVPLIGEGGGSIFLGNSSVGSFPSVIPAGFSFIVPREAIKERGLFKVMIFNSNPQNINEIKIKKGGT